MTHHCARNAILVISFAITVLNTMPIWLVELQAKDGDSGIDPGVLASALLIATSLGCVIGQRLQSPWLSHLLGILVFALLLGAAFNETIEPRFITLGAMLFGVFMGVILAGPLIASADDENALRAFGTGLSLGCVLSLGVLIAAAVSGFAILPMLALLSLLQVWAARASSPPSTFTFSLASLRNDLSLFPFFVLMGAYWAFLEVFALDRGFNSVEAWLAGSLILSAIGSFLAGALPTNSRNTAALAGLGLASVAGGLTYLATTELWLGLMILANAFGLFLFVPIYLNQTDAPVFGMARYLLGFALGGGVGSLALALAGYAGLAAALFLSGSIALAARLLDRG